MFLLFDNTIAQFLKFYKNKKKNLYFESYFSWQYLIFCDEMKIVAVFYYEFFCLIEKQFFSFLTCFFFNANSI